MNQALLGFKLLNQNVNKVFMTQSFYLAEQYFNNLFFIFPFDLNSIFLESKHFSMSLFHVSLYVTLVVSCLSGASAACKKKSAGDLQKQLGKGNFNCG